MSDVNQNRPALDPEIPEKAKTPETPTTRVEQQLKKAAKKVKEYKKDIKFLWIYSSVFCLVMLALIGGSYVIQSKVHSQVENLQNQAQDANKDNAATKSQLSNIREKNKQLESEVTALKDKNETLSAGAKLDAELITKGERIIYAQNKLLEAVTLYAQGNTAAAKESFGAVDKAVLPEEILEIYTYYEERLG